MNHADDKILSVASCAKRFGIAIFAQSELIYFAVKTLKSPRTDTSIKREVSRIIQTLFEEFEPGRVVLKLLGKQQIKSKNLQSVVRRVKREAEAARIPLREISFEQTKRELCLHQKPTKTNTFKSLCAFYPELKQFVNHPSKWQAGEYYNSLLSAVAIGYYYQNKVEQSLKRN